MKPASFDSTLEFQHFKDVMRKVITVPKARLDALVEASRVASPRNGNPNAPGRKSKKRSSSRRTRP